MDDLKLVSEDGEPNPQDKEAVIEGLLSFHKAKGHPREKSYFSIFLKNQSAKVMGGILVSFEWNGMDIQRLWIDESLRGQGWGTKLVTQAEKEALKRGCSISHVNTFTWQAPKFYEKLGYTLCGKLENHPKGESLNYYRKDLK